MEELSGRLVQPLIGVSAKEVALGLQEIRREASAAIAVVVSEASGKGRDGHTALDGSTNGTTPSGLRLNEHLGEERSQHQVLKVGIGLIGLLNTVQESRPYDATATPDSGNIPEVQIPVVELASRGEEVETLGIADDLARVEGIADIVDELLAISRERLHLYCG
jgi:hypothetical protein